MMAHFANLESNEEYIVLGDVRSRRMLYVVLCKQGDPHIGYVPFLKCVDAESVAETVNKWNHVCGPHRVGGYYVAV